MPLQEYPMKIPNLFVREFNGWEYAFVHNGVLHDYEKELPIGRWKPVGDTDSEFSFCLLLNMMEDMQLMRDNEPIWDDESFVELENVMKEINQYGKFNCLLADGRYLFCYRDKDDI